LRRKNKWAGLGNSAAARDIYFLEGRRNARRWPASATLPSVEEIHMKPIRTLMLAALACAGAAALAQTPGPTDPQIAAIVVAANQADIDAGKLAETQAQSKDVQAFAQRMVADHTSVNQTAVNLVHKLGVTPAASPTSDSLQQGGAANLANLKPLQGAPFDRAYIDHEVAYHEQVIDALDKTLIPSAQNAELKALLVKVRPAFVAHLDHAKRVQASLAKSQ
jgi:putative membrane protein